MGRVAGSAGLVAADLAALVAAAARPAVRVVEGVAVVEAQRAAPRRSPILVAHAESAGALMVAAVPEPGALRAAAAAVGMAVATATMAIAMESM